MGSVADEFPLARGALRRRAQTLRERAAAAGEPGLNIRVTEIVDLFPTPYDPDPLPADATAAERRDAELDACAFAGGMLARHGIRAAPALTTAGPTGVVNLRPTRRYALQGAAGFGAIAVLLAGLTSKIAGAGFAPFVVLGIAIVAWKLPLLDRVLPSVIPRGRALGAVVVLVLLVLSLVAVVNPVRERVRAEGNHRNAIANAAQANQLLTAGEVVRAIEFAQAAAAFDADAPGVEAAVDSTDRAGRALLAQAAALQAAGSWERAQEQLAELGSLYAAPSIAAQYRRDNANALIIETEAALAADEPNAAFEAYGAALRWDPTVADDYLVFRIAAAFDAN